MKRVSQKVDAATLQAIAASEKRIMKKMEQLLNESKQFNFSISKKACLKSMDWGDLGNRTSIFYPNLLLKELPRLPQ